jgi:hypothetical protein
MEDRRLAVHRTIVVVDVEGFGNRSRTNRNQVAVREGLYGAMRKAFDRSGIRWADCRHEDLGDGVLILVPPEVPKGLFVELLPSALGAALRAHNDTHPGQERIRLRMALHAGEVHYDEHGVTGASVTLAFRLMDAGELKAALAGSAGVRWRSSHRRGSSRRLYGTVLSTSPRIAASKLMSRHPSALGQVCSVSSHRRFECACGSPAHRVDQMYSTRDVVVTKREQTGRAPTPCARPTLVLDPRDRAWRSSVTRGHNSPACQARISASRRAWSRGGMVMLSAHAWISAAHSMTVEWSTAPWTWK